MKLQQQQQQQDYQYNLEKQYKIVDRLVENKQQKQQYQSSSSYDHNTSQASNSQYANNFKIATKPAPVPTTLNGGSNGRSNRVKFNDIIQVFEHKANDEIFTGVPVQPTYHQTTPTVPTLDRASPAPLPIARLESPSPRPATTTTQSVHATR